VRGCGCRGRDRLYGKTRTSEGGGDGGDSIEWLVHVFS
jgi:hypothetical protein